MDVDISDIVRYVGSNSNNLYHAFIDDMSGIQIKLIISNII